MAISDKLTYLSETKNQLKETINYAGAGLTDETFRQYPSKLYNKYIDILKDNGEELFNGLPKATGTGTSITLNNTANTRMKMSLAPSATSQATSILPDGYTQVDYIQSSGKQYIDTNYIVKSNTKVEVDFKSNQVAGGTFHTLFGTQNSANDGRFYFMFGTTNNYQVNLPRNGALQAGLNANGTVVIGDTGDYWTNDRAIFTLDVANKVAKINNITWNLSGLTGDYVAPSYNLYLLTRNASGSPNHDHMAEGLLYSAKIYEGTTIIRNMIPCYRNSDNEVGMYDTVNGVFYTNAGTNTFTYGLVATLPNPDYPQDIHTVSGNNTIKIEGKNLFNPNQTLTQGQYNAGTWEYVNNRVTTDYIETKKDDQWNIYCDLENENDVALINYNLFDENKNWMGSRTENGDTAFGGEKSHSFTINLVNTKYMRITFRRYSNTASSLTMDAVRNSKIQLTKGLVQQTYTPYTSQTLPLNLGTIELCKIDTYEDYFYKESDKWYLHKETNRNKVGTSGTWVYNETTKVFTRSWNMSSHNNIAYCNYLPFGTTGDYGFTIGKYGVYIKNKDYTDLDSFKDWVSSIDLYIYFIAQNTSNTEITDTTLINQLEAIYNKALSYDTQTNISQANNDLPFVISATCVKSTNSAFE